MCSAAGKPGSPLPPDLEEVSMTWDAQLAQKQLGRPPVACDMTFEPKEVLMVVVKETALRLESTTDR